MVQHRWMVAFTFALLAVAAGAIGAPPEVGRTDGLRDNKSMRDLKSNREIRFRAKVDDGGCLEGLGTSYNDCTATLTSTECRSKEFGPCSCTGDLIVRREANQPAPFPDGSQWTGVGVTFETTCHATAGVRRDSAPRVDVRAVGHGTVAPSGRFRFDAGGTGRRFGNPDSNDARESDHWVVTTCQLASVICGILLTPSPLAE